jgi:hypothetical protein
MVENGKESVTFRLECKQLEVLRHEAEQRHVSLNTLANQIFASFVEWEMSANKAGWMILPKEVIKTVFNSLSEEKVAAMAALAAVHAKEANLAMKGVDTFDAYYSITKNRLLRCGFHTTEQKSDGALRLNVQHHMGEKWSAFFKAQCQSVIEDFGKKCNITTTDNTVSIEVVDAGR